MAEKWVCSDWELHPEKYPTIHVFDKGNEEEEGFCPEDPAFHGVLMLKQWPPPGGNTPAVTITYPSKTDSFVKGSTINILAEASVKEGEIARVEFFIDDDKIGEDSTSPFTYNYAITKEEDFVIKVMAWTDVGLSDTAEINVSVTSGGVDPEIGLCIMMMDASASMLDIAYEGISPLTKLRLVATSAAAGIFDLQRMHNNPHAFVAGYKFDDRYELMFMDTVANLINRYDRDVRKFAAYIYEELFKMQQGTDINQALAVAHSFVDKFMKKQLPKFPLPRYTPMIQRILKYNSNQSVAIPNVRVLIYTDGMQFDTRGSKILHDNPFTKDLIPGVNHDIVIGAFFGKENDDGCKELKGLVSKCPIHDVEQFFLFDSPDKIGNLKYLFRMASGASGFCPKCLDKELKMEV
ncbi:MAG: Ig-like domain-containing protein [Ferruginibacter sp.]